MKIRGETALVTGASRRIGRALALALAENGCNVAVHYHSAEADALKTRDMARTSGVNSEAIQADLTIADECERLWTEAVEKMGDIPSIIINNASLFDRVSIENFTSDDFDRAMSVNVRAPLFLAQAMARDLPEGGTGKIININDRRMAYRSRITYAITNSALTGLTKTLAIKPCTQYPIQRTSAWRHTPFRQQRRHPTRLIFKPDDRASRQDGHS